MSCQQGTHKYLLETVGKGYYEVIGTLNQGNTITEMNTVSMGEGLSARRPARAPAPHAHASCTWAVPRGERARC